MSKSHNTTTDEIGAHRPAPESLVKINSNRLLNSATAASLGSVSSWDVFTRQRNTTTVAFRAGTMSLRLPEVCVGSAAPAKIAKPWNQPSKPGEFLEEIEYPQMNLTRLDNVLCIPGGVAISQDGILLSESFSAYWETQPHHYLTSQENGQYSVITDVDTSAFLPGRYLFIDYQHLDHYGHFLFDVVSRFWAIEFAAAIGMDDIQILVRDSSVIYVDAFLEKFNIHESQIKRINAPVVCEELFIATKSIQIQEYTSPAAERTWSTIKSRTTLTFGFPKRIYVSRAKNKHRPLLNEKKVEEIFLKFRFFVIYPEELSTDDQISIFSQAELIAGSSGTNIFNIAFQNYLAATLIITSPMLIQYSEQFLNGAIGGHLSYFVGQAYQPPLAQNEYEDTLADPIHGAWLVPDLDALEAAIIEWLNDYGGGK